MGNKIKITSFFDRRYNRLVKKFPSLQNELNELEKELKLNPFIGVSLGSGLYKIRLADKDKGKGKSGGFRVITYLVFQTKDTRLIYLLVIYDKSEDSTFKKDILIKLVKNILG